MATRTEPVRLPSTDELEGATDKIAHAIGAIDAIKMALERKPPPNAGLAEALAKVKVDLSIDAVGRLFLFASDAVAAAGEIRENAEAILASLPGLWQARDDAKGEWS